MSKKPIKRERYEAAFTALYVDKGCDLHPACLTCPFERCRYDAAPDYDLTHSTTIGKHLSRSS